MLKKIKEELISFLKIISEVFYEILKKFLIFYYIIFIVGLLISIKNKNVDLEVVIVSSLFLLLTQIYYKNYNKITKFLNEICKEKRERKVN